MTHKEDETLEVLQHFEDMKRKKEKAKKEASDVIREQNVLIEKYNKALDMAVFDILVSLIHHSLLGRCSRCRYCPLEGDCDKENMTATDCRRKFMKRWKGDAGLI